MCYTYDSTYVFVPLSDLVETIAGLVVRNIRYGKNEMYDKDNDGSARVVPLSCTSHFPLGA